MSSKESTLGQSQSPSRTLREIPNDVKTVESMELGNGTKENVCPLQSDSNDACTSISPSNGKKAKKRKPPTTSSNPSKNRMMKKRKPLTIKQQKEVMKTLGNLGFKENEYFGDTDIGNCALQAIFNGYIKFSEEKDLDQVLVSGELSCGHMAHATLRDCLGQHDAYPNEEYSVCCVEEDKCGVAVNVSWICKGKPSLEDNPKFIHHCIQCKKCYSSFAWEHCDNCGKHWYAGMAGAPRCTLCGVRVGFKPGEESSNSDTSETADEAKDSFMRVMGFMGNFNKNKYKV